MPEPKVFSDEELINMIDPILKNDDKNGIISLLVKYIIYKTFKKLYKLEFLFSFR